MRMDMTASVAGFPYFAPNPGDGPSVDGYPQHGVWAGGEASTTQPVACRPISQFGDDARDDAEIGSLERQLAAQQREIRELRHELRADRREDDRDRCDNDDGRRIVQHYTGGQARPL